MQLTPCCVTVACNTDGKSLSQQVFSTRPALLEDGDADGLTDDSPLVNARGRGKGGTGGGGCGLVGGTDARLADAAEADRELLGDADADRDELEDGTPGNGNGKADEALTDLADTDTALTDTALTDTALTADDAAETGLMLTADGTLKDDTRPDTDEKGDDGDTTDASDAAELEKEGKGRGGTQQRILVM